MSHGSTHGTYETVNDGPPVLPILIGTIGIYLGLLAMLMLLLSH